MSEKEKIIIEKVKETIPDMTEFDKGYILGMMESYAQKNKKTEQEKEKK